VWGGAVSAALQIKNIPTGTGDDVKIEGTVGKGATKYIIGTAFALPGSFSMTKANAFTTAGTIAIGAINDGVYGGWMTPLQASVQLTRGWGFRGAFNLALLRLGQNQSRWPVRMRSRGAQRAGATFPAATRPLERRLSRLMAPALRLNALNATCRYPMRAPGTF
jgi:hypothetical protein